MEEIIYGAGRPRTGQYLKCETCGKEFYANPARIRQVKKQGNIIRYCSMKCYDKKGNKNPFWGQKHSKDTIQRFLKNPNRNIFKKGTKNPNFIRFAEGKYFGTTIGWWQKYLKRTIGKCEECSFKKYIEILEVHHLDRNRENNTRKNLRLFCPNCHQIWHLLDKSGRYTPKDRKNGRFISKKL